MAKSTTCIADIGTVIASGPSTTTKTNALAAAGPIMDYQGNCIVLKTMLQDAQMLLAGPIPSASGGIIAATDSTDATNLGLLQGIAACLAGSSQPSTQVMTDLNTVITNGPNAATKAKAIAAAGRIMDYVGMLNILKTKLQDVLFIINGVNGSTGLYGVTANSDDSTNKGLIQGIALVIV